MMKVPTKSYHCHMLVQKIIKKVKKSKQILNFIVTAFVHMLRNISYNVGILFNVYIGIKCGKNILQ